jgi:hypothetical protein
MGTTADRRVPLKINDFDLRVIAIRIAATRVNMTHSIWVGASGSQSGGLVFCAATKRRTAAGAKPAYFSHSLPCTMNCQFPLKVPISP